jgi:DNA-binding LacI/PurR family transcriptional regulator
LNARGIEAIVLDEIELLAATLLAVPAFASTDIYWVGLGESGAAPALVECTQIEFGCEEIGRRAAHAVLQRLEQGREDPPVHVRVAPRIADFEPAVPQAVKR